MLCEIFQLSILYNILTYSPLFRYKVIFPYFWYPFKNVVTSGCVFMVVAVAAERYFAICKPLTLKPKPIFFIRLVTFHSVNIYWFFCCSDFTWNQSTFRLYQNSAAIKLTAYEIADLDAVQIGGKIWLCRKITKFLHCAFLLVTLPLKLSIICYNIFH